MGTLMGHIIPGSFFLAFAIWWTIQHSRRYYASLQRAGSKYKSSVTFPCSCLPGKLKDLEVEGILKILLCAVGIAGETITGFADGHFAYMGNGQHITMFSFFAFSGFIDILVHNNVPLPNGIEFAVSLLAFAVEGVLFQFHIEGREGLDVLLHTLLVYIIVSTVAVGLAEMCCRENALVALTRVYLVMVQGSWFCQVGWILYPPGENAEQWKPNDHDEKFLATMMFAWHLGGALLAMLVIGGVVGCFYRRRYGPFDLLHNPYDALEMQLVHRNSNGHTVVKMQEDSDSDIEFERPVTRTPASDR